jgi:hypothetical protein
MSGRYDQYIRILGTWVPSVDRSAIKHYQYYVVLIIKILVEELRVASTTNTSYRTYVLFSVIIFFVSCSVRRERLFSRVKKQVQ